MNAELKYSIIYSIFFSNYSFYSAIVIECLDFI